MNEWTTMMVNRQLIKERIERASEARRVRRRPR